jgi:predicted phage-related endonuclease
MELTLIPKPKHGSEEWLRNRWRDPQGRCVFGASDIPVLMGVSPWRNRAELFIDKSTPPVVKAETVAMRRGNLLERPLLEEASTILGVKLVTPEFQYHKGRLMVSHDGLPDGDLENPEFGVEVKTTASHAIETADDLPADWRWQAWAQSETIGGKPVFFVVLDKRQNITVVELADNPEARQSLLVEAEDFGSLIDDGAPLGDLVQELDSDAIAAYFRPTAEPRELGSDATQWLNMLEAARLARTEAEKSEKLAKDALARLLQDAEVGTLNGLPVVSWKESAGRETLDAKALKAELPEVYEHYIRQGAPYRTMRMLKGDK